MTRSPSTDIIKLVKPKVYVKGIDYKDNKQDDTKKIYLEKKMVEKYGGKIKYTNEDAFSSSSIINQKVFYILTNKKII